MNIDKNGTLWGLYNPDGKLLGVFEYEFSAWVHAFDLQTVRFQHKYWKKAEESQKALKAQGWVVCKGLFFPEPLR